LLLLNKIMALQSLIGIHFYDTALVGRVSPCPRPAAVPSDAIFGQPPHGTRNRQV